MSSLAAGEWIGIEKDPVAERLRVETEEISGRLDYPLMLFGDATRFVGTIARELAGLTGADDRGFWTLGGRHHVRRPLRFTLPVGYFFAGTSALATHSHLPPVITQVSVQRS
jgi:hypothetical protein